MQVAGYDGDHPALELINSQRWYGRGSDGDDTLADPVWLAGYLERWSLGTLPRPRERELELLRSLRRVLREAYTALGARGRVARDDVQALDAYLSAAPIRRRFTADEGGHAVTLEPVARDWRWVAAEIAASFAELIESGDPVRMKLCENPECRCAFYDESKNRSRRWCYPEVCGNLDKVRRFRERQRRTRAGDARE